jgi:hypothetical protein
MRPNHHLTDAERDQHRHQDRRRLHLAAQQLLTAEGWQRWVRVRAKGGLARLSLNNQLLVALSCPEATFVAGFKAWIAMGYCVRKGGRGIQIIAPIPLKQRENDQTVDASAADGEARPRVLFKAVTVFDRSQVTPIDGADPTPLEPPM